MNTSSRKKSVNLVMSHKKGTMLVPGHCRCWIWKLHQREWRRLWSYFLCYTVYLFFFLLICYCFSVWRGVCVRWVQMPPCTCGTQRAHCRIQFFFSIHEVSRDQTQVFDLTATQFIYWAIGVILSLFLSTEPSYCFFFLISTPYRTSKILAQFLCFPKLLNSKRKRKEGRK